MCRRFDLAEIASTLQRLAAPGKILLQAEQFSKKILVTLDAIEHFRRIHEFSESR